jgi:copper(I)-binding protein
VILSSLSSRPARGLIAVAAATLIPVLAGCEAGLNAPVLQWHRPTPGASAVVGSIRINNMFILGATPDSTLQPGTSTGVFFAMSSNGGPDTLVGISAPGSAGSVSLPGGSVALGSGQTVRLTGPVPQVVLQNLTRPLRGGQFIRLVLTFQNAGSVPMSVPIMPMSQYFSSFSPAPSPTPTATPGKRKKPTPSASPTSSP